jgi:hypothetical protein
VRGTRFAERRAVVIQEGEAMTRLLATSLVLLLSSACSGGSETSSPPPAAAQPVVPSQPGLPYTVADGLPSWTASYAASNLADANPSTQWYTPMNPAPPIVATLNLRAAAELTSIDLDTRLGSYETSAIREVTIEALGQGGAVLATAQASLQRNTVNTVPIATDGAMAVRLTFRSNHGGSYYGLADVTVRGSASSLPPPPPPEAPPQAPALGRGLSFSVADGLPFWNDGYAVANLADGNPTTQWYTPMSPTYPVQGVLVLPAPAGVTGLVFDNHLGSYDSSGAREVTIELLDAGQQVIATANASLPQASITPVPIAAQAQASSVRLTFRSNHGGPYLGLADINVQGTGLPAL